MNILKTKGRGGGDVVSVLAFYSDDQSLIPAEVKRTKIKKEARDGPFKKY